MEVLLGAEASEAGFREAVAKRPRWRAVHFACHGLVDPERPTLSSLAPTASGDDDGFLTALDVFRMKIPADLVVLSACETGKGKIVKGEERIVHFLDGKGTVRQTDFKHPKAAVCQSCTLNDVCGGLFELGDHYDLAELSPVFVPLDEVVRRVRAEAD